MNHTIDKFITFKQKAAIFNVLYKNKLNHQGYRYMEDKVCHLYSKVLKKRVFSRLKINSLAEKTNDFERKVRDRTEEGLINYEAALKKQKEELLFLIIKAEERLNYENKRKIQVKLELDKIVLRGISALNMQALMLSQGSLGG